MYIGFFNHHRYYNKNRMFLNSSSLLGDDMMSPFVELKKNLEKSGHRIATVDQDKLEKFNAVVFLEFPGFKNKYFKKLIKNKFQNLYLVVAESPVVKPDNLDLKNHKYFKKIFTWDDRVIDNKKYFKLNYALQKPDNVNFNLSKKEKLCCMISGNKMVGRKNELYTERIEAIRWFEKNHPEDFDLYGFGWDRYYFHGKFLGFNLLRLNRLKRLAKILGPAYPSYKGSVKSKKETFKKYKFAICYENCQGFDGYITEKIFDCFFSGCVPIYLGAPNISKKIPANTFIDKRKFKNYDEIYKFVKNMNESQYINYLQNIKNFIESEKFSPFSIEQFIDILAKEII